MLVFDSERFCGYKQVTTFFSDFSIADRFGLAAIRDTYERAFEAWHDDVVFITEMCMVLNWKSWQWTKIKEDYCGLYIELYYKLRDWCFDNLKGDDLSYYITTTD